MALLTKVLTEEKNLAEEKVKIELEVPKDNVHIESVKAEPELSEEKKQKQAQAKQHARAAEAKVKEAEAIEKEAEKKATESEDKKTESTELASYRPSEVAKAPLEPPEPKGNEPPNKHQRQVMFFGFAVVLAGAILWPLTTFTVGIGVAIAGAAAIAFGTLVRI